jgi:hypothetical protein
MMQPPITRSIVAGDGSAPEPFAADERVSRLDGKYVDLAFALQSLGDSEVQILVSSVPRFHEASSYVQKLDSAFKGTGKWFPQEKGRPRKRFRAPEQLSFAEQVKVLANARVLKTEENSEKKARKARQNHADDSPAPRELRNLRSNLGPAWQLV